MPPLRALEERPVARTIGTLNLSVIIGSTSCPIRPPSCGRPSRSILLLFGHKETVFEPPYHFRRHV